MSKKPKTIQIAIDDIVPHYADQASNPNKMEPEKFALLVEAMKRDGQSLTAVFINEKNEMFDGHHRYWAAKEAGLKVLPAVVFPVEGLYGVARGFGLNNLRGTPDLTIASLELQQIATDTDFSFEDISVFTGFTQDELEALLKPSAGEEDPADQFGGDTPDEEPDHVAKPYVLEIAFADKAQYKLAKRKLRKAAGKGGELAQGLLRVLGEEESE